MAKPKKTDQAQIFHAGEQEAGDTLLAALRGWLPETSWNEARRLVRKRHVQVNGNLCLDEARRLKAKEVVKVHKFPLAPPPTADRVKIIYVDDQIIVVEKPMRCCPKCSPIRSGRGEKVSLRHPLRRVPLSGIPARKNIDSRRTLSGVSIATTLLRRDCHWWFQCIDWTAKRAA
ncbi:MAG: hypothetical protein LW697_01980 [Blastopirellula sp.]|nr:hypothetical protein [Blastopirellula sp.]